MNNSKLEQLVTEAVVLDRLIAERSARLKEIKVELIAEAKNRPDACTETEGGGKAWSAFDIDGNIARVNFPAPTLKSGIDGEGKTIERIRNAAGRFFASLFDQAPKYVPVENFRAEAEKLLGKDAKKLIKLCSTDSSPRVSFETKEKPE